MELTADMWQARAAMCELLALSFRYPEQTLAEVVASGEWAEAADEIASACGLDWKSSGALINEGSGEDTESVLHALRKESTHLFIGAPDPVISPYEGMWRAEDDGVQGLLFVNPHSMDVERYCKACGLGRPEGTNEPLDHVATELELLEFLAARAALDASDGQSLPEDIDSAADISTSESNGLIDSADLPGGSAKMAYDVFIQDHVSAWMPRFADKVQEEARQPFFVQTASLLNAFLSK